MRVRSLTIGSKKTDWPGTPYPIALVDTGGGPVLLSDPDGYLYKTIWSEQVCLPDWAKTDGTSISCQAVRAPLTIELGDGRENSKCFLSALFNYILIDNTFLNEIRYADYTEAIAAKEGVALNISENDPC